MNEDAMVLKETKLYFWTLLGPMLLFVSAAMAIIFEKDVWPFGLALASVLLCYSFKKIGFFSALALITGFCGYEYLFSSPSLWHIGIKASIAISSFISFASLGIIELLFSGNSRAALKLKADFEALTESAKLKEQQLLEKISTMEKDFKGLEEELSEKKSEFDAIFKKISFEKQKLEKSVEEKQEEMRRLEEALKGKITFFEGDNISLKKKCEEASKLLEIIRQENASLVSKMAENELILKEAQNEIPELQKYKGLHKELRVQFEEKDALLHETRKDLFKLQEALAAIDKQSKEKSLENHEEPFVKRISELEDLLTQSYEENRSLNEIIQTLSR